MIRGRNKYKHKELSIRMKSKRKFSLIFICAIIIVGGYLWFGYANIYNRITAGGLSVVDTQYVYYFNLWSSQRLKYSAMGDSLTAAAGATKYENSYPYLLAKNIAGNERQVVLKDFSLLGARTEDVINKLMPLVIEEQPDMVTLLIGINDVRERESEQNFKKNYTYIVDSLSKQTSAKIYLISIPLIGSETVYLPPYNFYFKQKTIIFNEIIKTIAKDYNLQYIDITTPTENIFKKDGSHYSADSFHLSDEGYKILADEIYDNLNY